MCHFEKNFKNFLLRCAPWKCLGARENVSPGPAMALANSKCCYKLGLACSAEACCPFWPANSLIKSQTCDKRASLMCCVDACLLHVNKKVGQSSWNCCEWRLTANYWLRLTIHDNVDKPVCRLIDKVFWGLGEKIPDFSGLFQRHKLKYPQVIPTRSNCNNGNLEKNCKFPQWGLGLGWSHSWRHFCIKEAASGHTMRSPVWIHYCKRPSFDFWISQGSVETVTKRANVKFLLNVACQKFGQCFMKLFK